MKKSHDVRTDRAETVFKHWTRLQLEKIVKKIIYKSEIPMSSVNVLLVS